MTVDSDSSFNNLFICFFRPISAGNWSYILFPGWAESSPWHMFHRDACVCPSWPQTRYSYMIRSPWFLSLVSQINIWRKKHQKMVCTSMLIQSSKPVIYTQEMFSKISLSAPTPANPSPVHRGYQNIQDGQNMATGVVSPWDLFWFSQNAWWPSGGMSGTLSRITFSCRVLGYRGHGDEKIAALEKLATREMYSSTDSCYQCTHGARSGLYCAYSPPHVLRSVWYDQLNAPTMTTIDTRGETSTSSCDWPPASRILINHPPTINYLVVAYPPMAVCSPRAKKAF